MNKLASPLLHAFFNPTRVRLLNLLAQREHCDCEFQNILCVPQPHISRQLAYLRRSGLVQPRQIGKMNFYTVAPAVHDCVLLGLRNCFSGISSLKQDIVHDRRSKPILKQCETGRNSTKRKRRP